MVTCASCGEENPDRAHFCLNCGAALQAAPGPLEERKLVSVLFVDLVGGPGNDTFNGGPGTDTCSQGAGTGSATSCEL